MEKVRWLAHCLMPTVRLTIKDRRRDAFNGLILTGPAEELLCQDLIRNEWLIEDMEIPYGGKWGEVIVYICQGKEN